METIYSDWTVLDPTGRNWLCRCKCGVERRVYKADLKLGKSRGCGCEGRKRMRAAALLAVRTHGMDGTPTYQSWVDMRRRCNNPEREDYARYGARGIRVCPEWQDDFEAFFADMGLKPAGMTLERKDNEADYSKANCVWATRKTQERNKRNNRMVTVGGKTMCLAEACEVHGANYYATHRRLGRGWTIERALGLEA